MRIAVIGGGIGGLAAAVGLQHAGADVTVYERHRDLQQAGSGLSLFGNARTALDALGLGTAFERLTSTPFASLAAGQRRPDGRWLLRTPPTAIEALRVVQWSDLRQLLLSGLRPGTLHEGTSAHLDPPSTGLQLSPADPEQDPKGFSLVVAADGLQSQTRSAWPGDPGIRYAGYSTWRGITATPVRLDAAGETWGRGLRFGIAPLPDSRVYWFAVATMGEDAKFDDEVAEVRRLFGGWHRPIPQLLDATDPAQITRWPIHDLSAALRTYVHGRTVLLGDAAHAMTPDLGQGAGQALEDAATLAGLLSAHAAGPSPDPQAVSRALAGYDELRRARTQAMVRQSRLLGRVAQTPSPALAAVRDLALRSTPRSVVGRRLQKIQQWSPPVASSLGTRNTRRS